MKNENANYEDIIEAIKFDEPMREKIVRAVNNFDNLLCLVKEAANNFHDLNGDDCDENKPCIFCEAIAQAEGR